MTGSTSTRRYIRPETMTDKPLFNLDAEGRWRLAYDSQQWVIQRRTGKPCRRGSDSAAMRRTGWKGVSFVGSTKTTLRRVLGEKGVVLTPEAVARLDALPERFMDFIAAPERFWFFAWPEAEAA